MSDYQEYDCKYVQVYGDKHAKARKDAQPAYERKLATRPITFVCVVCQKSTTQERFPGPRPRYCSDACKMEGTRLKTQARGERYREREAKKKQEQRQPAS